MLAISTMDAAAGAQECAGANQTAERQQAAGFGDGREVAQRDEMTARKWGGKVVAAADGVIADRPLVTVCKARNPEIKASI